MSKQFPRIFLFLILAISVISMQMLIKWQIEYYSTMPRPTYILSGEEFQALARRLGDIVNREDPKKALRYLAVLSKSNQAIARSCHDLTHEIGHQAYEKYQTVDRALSFQSEDCNNGFFHGVIEGHFARNDDIFKGIQNVCTSTKLQATTILWQCYHGVGHGAMYATANELPKSLALCETFSDTDARLSCVNGVFMENFNTDVFEHPSAYLNPVQPLFPCADQKEEYKKSCYTYAPAYYLSQRVNDYQGALNLCAQAETAYVSICLAGVGSQIMKENIDDVRAADRACSQGTFSQTPSCLWGVFSYFSINNGKNDATVCSQLPSSHQKLCLQAQGAT